MTVFIIAAGLLLFVSMMFVLGPLWWRGASASGSRREANISVYEQHLAEVDRQLDLGQITTAEATQQREALGARLVDEVDAAPQGKQYVSHRPWFASMVVIAGFAVIAGGMYGWLGDTRGFAPQQSPDISALVAKMKTHLATAPDDHRTRALLGQVQMTRRKYPAAAQTFNKLNMGLETPNPVFLLAEARARVLTDGGTVDKRSRELYLHVLALEPDNIEALWFAGLAALAHDNSEQAAAYWQHLLTQPDVPDQFRAQVGRRLAEVQGNKPSLGTDN